MCLITHNATPELIKHIQIYQISRDLVSIFSLNLGKKEGKVDVDNLANSLDKLSVKPTVEQKKG